MSEGSLAPGTVLAGKFRVVAALGEGGMGAVYEIEHELTKHRRALKLLHKSMAAVPSVVERFLREASAAGRAGNPHIVETFDAGVLDSGEPYLVMEILRGEPLSSRIERGRMSVAEVVDLIGQAASGVQAAHDAGIVHRDLKPDNLFITEGGDGRPFVKILDFGISKFDPQKTGGLQLTQEGAALGTPYYMSPEQIRGEGSLDARADVYALGVILYECLAGVRPFEAETLAHLAILIHTGQPVPVAQLRPDLPPGFAEIVEAAMATDRGKRTGSAGELRAALARFGAVGAHSVVRNSPLPPPSLVPARSVLPGRPMSTSAAGISLRPAQLSKPTSPVVWIALGLGLSLAAAAAGAAWWSHARAVALEIASAAPTPSHPLPSSGTPAAPSTVTHEPAPVPPVPLTPSPSVLPALVDSAPHAANPPSPPQSALGSAPPRGVTPHPVGRADQRGLAKDNPFK